MGMTSTSPGGGTSGAYVPQSASVTIPANRFTRVSSGGTITATFAGLTPVYTIADAVGVSVGAGLNERDFLGWTAVHIDVLFAMNGTAGGDVGLRGGIFALPEAGDLGGSAFSGSVVGYPAPTVANQIVRARIATSAAFSPQLVNTVAVNIVRTTGTDTATDTMIFVGVRLVRAS
jgi:hypothetical protein